MILNVTDNQYGRLS